MKLIFKYVGQGDSIILHWKAGGLNKFIIVDCNTISGETPTLNYIKSFPSPEVIAIILSHPHTDHFSGMEQLFRGLLQVNIPIRFFWHTASHNEAYFTTSVKGSDAKTKLKRLFVLVREMRDAGNLELATLDGGTPTPVINLDEDTRIFVLAPTSREYDNYLASTNLPTKFEGTNNPQANWLSTVLRIERGNKYYLLTSDAEKFTLKGLDQRQVVNQNELEFVLGQIPHHGSIKNYNNTFWSKRRREGNSPVAVISSGPNSYGHPSPELVAKLSALGYDVKVTGSNAVLSVPAQAVITYLDVFSAQTSITDEDPRDVIIDL